MFLDCDVRSDDCVGVMMVWRYMMSPLACALLYVCGRMYSCEVCTILTFLEYRIRLRDSRYCTWPPLFFNQDFHIRRDTIAPSETPIETTLKLRPNILSYE
jgi:hypothetical protein